MKIILIDDEPSILLSFAYLFRGMGHEVATFENPTICPLYTDHECTCTMEKPCCDLLLIDNQMPRMTGLEFIRQQHTRGCKGITRNKAIMSGDLSPEDERTALELGCRVFHKPMDLEEVLEWVRECESRLGSDS